MMNTKDFIALANHIKECFSKQEKDHCTIEMLASFCKKQNPLFNRERWIGYIRGACGPRGGKVK